MRSAYLEQVLADAPIVLWEGQEASGNPQDTSGAGLHAATISGGADYREPGPMRDGGIRFVGGEGCSRGVVSTETTTLTLEILVRAEAIAGDSQNLIYNGNGGANGYGLVIGTAGSLAVKPLLGGVVIGAPNGATLDGSWRHVALRRDAGGVWNHFVDGTKYNPATSANPGVPSGNFTIGGSAAFQFAWAYAAMYSTDLSDARIAEHYAAFKSLVRSGVLVNG